MKDRTEKALGSALALTCCGFPSFILSPDVDLASTMCCPPEEGCGSFPSKNTDSCKLANICCLITKLSSLHSCSGAAVSEHPCYSLRMGRLFADSLLFVVISK